MKLYSFIVVGLLFLGSSAFGQSVLNNVEFSWSIPETEDTTGLGEDDLTYIMKEFHLEIQVSSSVNEIQVKMGPVVDSDDFVGRRFSLAENAEYDDGSAITIDGSNIDIRLGYFQGLRSFVLRVMAIGENGGVLEVIDRTYP